MDDVARRRRGTARRAHHIDSALVGSSRHHRCHVRAWGAGLAAIPDPVACFGGCGGQRAGAGGSRMELAALVISQPAHYGGCGALHARSAAGGNQRDAPVAKTYGKLPSFPKIVVLPSDARLYLVIPF